MILTIAATVILGGAGMEQVKAKPEVKLTSGVIPVKVVQQQGKWQLLRGGKPYFIKGAGGAGLEGPNDQASIKRFGGNSIRTWGSDNIEAEIENAHKLGMTMTIGLWLGHRRHGMKYDDPKMVADQLETMRGYVRKYRNHPALLMWGVGNEVELDGEDPLVWKAIEQMAAMIKQEDPNHPTMVVVAEIGDKKARIIQEMCPSIDVLGINTYGGVRDLNNRIKAQGWTKPYALTEFGPLGPWEMPKTAWGAPEEQTSSQKANLYRFAYSQVINSKPDQCIGSYTFLWGNKQEGTDTWFGILLPTGEKLEQTDVISEAWTGKKPANLSPRIDPIVLDLKKDRYEEGETIVATAIARDPERDPLQYRWVVKREQTKFLTGGDEEEKPETIVRTGRTSSPRFTYKLPSQKGGYRIFVWAYDGKGSAATANYRLYVGAN